MNTAFTFAQSPLPTPTPEGDVVKISTNLIQVDVTVTDRSGKMIPDLRSDEIEIYENGKKQKITNFSFISNVRETSVEKKTEKGVVNLPPTGAVKPENVRRAIALVVDDLSLSFESVHFVRRALKKFVDEQMEDGDLVAIIRTGAGIGALQQFTTDKRILYAAIERVRWNPIGSGRIGAFEPLQARIETEEEEDAEPGVRTQEGREREQENFRTSIFATGTLGAVNYVVRGMRELPGRKSIMLLSEGFKLFTKDASGFSESGRTLEQLRRLVDQANRASVVIYTLDPRGLQVLGLTAADDTGGRTAQQVQDEISDRRDQLLDTQDGLRYLAKETGGTAIVNNNDLSGGIRKILDDQSYYLVAYEPDDETFDPKTRRFNKLEVRVTRRDARVRYRSGFFGVSDEASAPKATTANQRILEALTSPFAMNDISLRMNGLFGNDEKEGSYIKSLVHVKADDIVFTPEQNGKWTAKFDVLAVAFGDNGLVVNQISKTYTLSLEKSAYETFQKKGFVYHFIVPVKKPGGYQLRIAMRDHNSEKVGSASQFVEVPDLKKNRITLSGITFESISYDQYEKASRDPNFVLGSTDPLTDTSLRQFKIGSVLNLGFVIFNPKASNTKPTSLLFKMRVFRDGNVIYDGTEKPLPATTGNGSPKSIPFARSLSLGTEMTVGDYILEITIIDNNAKKKNRETRSYAQFEVVE
ncbi:MAG: VWA domain-containing protein [Pyrinomonadaceae bacterium]